MKLFNWLKGSDVSDRTDVTTKEYVVRFKDIFLVVDEMSDGSYDVGWARTPMSHTPIRDFWIAVPPKESK